MNLYSIMCDASLEMATQIDLESQDNSDEYDNNNNNDNNNTKL